MNTDPQLLVRHGVLLPPSLAPVAAKKAPQAAIAAENWQARQLRFRRLALGVGGGMLLLLVAAFASQRRAVEARDAHAQPQRQRALARHGVPVVTAISVASRPSASARIAAPPAVSARLAPEKIAASERSTKVQRLGVSKPQSLSVSRGAFDAPFVPPAD